MRFTRNFTTSLKLMGKKRRKNSVLTVTMPTESLFQKITPPNSAAFFVTRYDFNRNSLTKTKGHDNKYVVPFAINSPAALIDRSST